MAKVSLTKLGLKVNQDIKTIEFNGQIIEVKQYLPIQEKLNIISSIINKESEYNNNNFINLPLIHVLTSLEIVYNYTNLSFTEKQKEDFGKTYDLLNSNGILTLIYDAIKDEYEYIVDNTIESANKAYEYKNSAYGIMDSMTKDYNNLNFDTSEIQKNLSDPENLNLLKDILTKLG